MSVSKQNRSESASFANSTDYYCNFGLTVLNEEDYYYDNSIHQEDNFCSDDHLTHSNSSSSKRNEEEELENTESNFNICNINNYDPDLSNFNSISASDYFIQNNISPINNFNYENVNVKADDDGHDGDNDKIKDSIDGNENCSIDQNYNTCRICLLKLYPNNNSNNNINSINEQNIDYPSYFLCSYCNEGIHSTCLKLIENRLLNKCKHCIKEYHTTNSIKRIKKILNSKKDSCRNNNINSNEEKLLKCDLCKNANYDLFLFYLETKNSKYIKKAYYTHLNCISNTIRNLINRNNTININTSNHSNNTRSLIIQSLDSCFNSNNSCIENMNILENSNPLFYFNNKKLVYDEEIIDRNKEKNGNGNTDSNSNDYGLFSKYQEFINTQPEDNNYVFEDSFIEASLSLLNLNDTNEISINNIHNTNKYINWQDFKQYEISDDFDYEEDNLLVDEYCYMRKNKVSQ